MVGDKLISELSSRSKEAEAFRIIRTNLQFLAVHRPFKTLLITSSGPFEGKSTLTANLGIVMAQAGLKVIIVDCDLREAKQHVIFSLPNDTGLTTVLLGSADLDLVIQDTDLPNLKVVTGGPQPPNPAELLNSPKASQVFFELSAAADIVLVDSPSVLTVSDTVVLSSMLDGVIMVIRTGKTRIDVFSRAKDRLQKANARIIGTVLNISNPISGYDDRKNSRQKLVYAKIKSSI